MFELIKSAYDNISDEDVAEDYLDFHKSENTLCNEIYKKLRSFSDANKKVASVIREEMIEEMVGFIPNKYENKILGQRQDKDNNVPPPDSK